MITLQLNGLAFQRKKERERERESSIRVSIARVAIINP